jgi:hypothetical protein
LVVLRMISYMIQQNKRNVCLEMGYVRIIFIVYLNDQVLKLKVTRLNDLINLFSK